MTDRSRTRNSQQLLPCNHDVVSRSVPPLAASVILPGFKFLIRFLVDF
ncbi:MAG: hypothetical protein ACK58L_03310 [Planctomycetota bacterium]